MLFGKKQTDFEKKIDDTRQALQLIGLEVLLEKELNEETGEKVWLIKHDGKPETTVSLCLVSLDTHMYFVHVTNSSSGNFFAGAGKEIMVDAIVEIMYTKSMIKLGQF